MDEIALRFLSPVRVAHFAHESTFVYFDAIYDGQREL